MTPLRFAMAVTQRNVVGSDVPVLQGSRRRNVRGIRVRGRDLESAAFYTINAADEVLSTPPRRPYGVTPYKNQNIETRLSLLLLDTYCNIELTASTDHGRGLVVVARKSPQVF